MFPVIPRTTLWQFLSFATSDVAMSVTSLKIVLLLTLVSGKERFNRRSGSGNTTEMRTKPTFWNPCISGRRQLFYITTNIVCPVEIRMLPKCETSPKIFQLHINQSCFKIVTDVLGSLHCFNIEKYALCRG